MLPVSALHFLVTLAYFFLAMGAVKVSAIALHNRSLGGALAFLAF